MVYRDIYRFPKHARGLLNAEQARQSLRIIILAMAFLKQIEETPLYNQYEGHFPILTPDYKDKQYIASFEKLKTMIKNQDFRYPSNYLSELILSKLPSNYNCWLVKRKCYQTGVLDLETELTWSRAFLLQNVKNFQGWEYRRFLLEQSKELGDEFDFIDQVLQVEQKNYHVWGYRVWLAQYFGQFQADKSRTLKWLGLDVMNNSVWAYRHFLFSNTIQGEKDLEKQIEFVMFSISKSKNNQAVWNYLRGWFPSIKLGGFPSVRPSNKTPVFQYQQFPQILDTCLKLAKEETAIEPLITLVHIHSQKSESTEYSLSVCELLVHRQPHKSNYWLWVRQNIQKTHG